MHITTADRQSRNYTGPMMKACQKCGMRAGGRHANSAVCKRAALTRKLKWSGLFAIQYSPAMRDAHARFTSTTAAAIEALTLCEFPVESHPTHSTGRQEAWTNREGCKRICWLNIIKAATRDSLPWIAKVLHRNTDILPAIEAAYRLTGDLDDLKSIFQSCQPKH